MTYHSQTQTVTIVEVWEWLSTIPHIIMDVIAYLCWDYDWTMLVKGAPKMFADNFSISVKQDGDKKPQTTFSNETYFFIETTYFTQMIDTAIVLVQSMVSRRPCDKPKPQSIITQFISAKNHQQFEWLKSTHYDVIKWRHFPRYWPFVRGIHRSSVNSPHKGQWRGALVFSLMCARINSWVNNREAGDLRRYRHHYDAIVMWHLKQWSSEHGAA